MGASISDPPPLASRSGRRVRATSPKLSLSSSSSAGGPAVRSRLAAVRSSPERAFRRVRSAWAAPVTSAAFSTTRRYTSSSSSDSEMDSAARLRRTSSRTRRPSPSSRVARSSAIAARSATTSTPSRSCLPSGCSGSIDATTRAPSTCPISVRSGHATTDAAARGRGAALSSFAAASQASTRGRNSGRSRLATASASSAKGPRSSSSANQPAVCSTFPPRTVTKATAPAGISACTCSTSRARVRSLREG